VCKEGIRIARKLSTQYYPRIATTQLGVVLLPRNPNRYSLIISALLDTGGLLGESLIIGVGTQANAYPLGTICFDQPTINLTIEQAGPIICEEIRLIDGAHPSALFLYRGESFFIEELARL
jgi:hypothetical protein